jgi:hypothetical protein
MGVTLLNGRLDGRKRPLVGCSPNTAAAALSRFGTSGHHYFLLLFVADKLSVASFALAVAVRSRKARAKLDGT